jgi:tellurite methyltransferase
MTGSIDSGTVRFFDTQFRRQAATGDYALNPFETRALPHVRGEVLDLGCGLGNLACAAAAHGAHVLALDASAAAIESLNSRAVAGAFAIDARVADLSDYVPEGGFDTVVAIGLFMFFPCPAARRQLARARNAVGPGGTLIVNVLIEGTTFMGMFDAKAGYCLFGEEELPNAVTGWQILEDRIEQFPAPEESTKRFRTTIARRPATMAVP